MRGDLSTGIERADESPVMSTSTTAGASVACEPTYAYLPSAEMQAACAAATATCLTIVSVVASTMTASFEPPADTTTRVPSGVIASPAGFAPTSIEVAMASLAVVITLTDPL